MILLVSRKLSGGLIFVLTNILIHARTYRVLPSIMTWGEFCQDAAQFNHNWCPEIKEKRFSLHALACDAKPSSAPKKTKRGDEDKGCGEKLVLPQGLKKWILKSVHAFLSTLFSLNLCRSHPGHKLIENPVLQSCWSAFVDLCTRYQKSQLVKESFSGLIYVPWIDNFHSFSGCS